jgi:hypothetical protein
MCKRGVGTYQEGAGERRAVVGNCKEGAGANLAD